MATVKSQYLYWNGITWDKYYFESSIDMVNGLQTALDGKATVKGRVVNDMNHADFRVSGMYGINGTPANGYGESYGGLIVAANSDVGLQIAGGYNNDDLYFRGWANSGAIYYDWRKLWHSGNLTGERSEHYHDSRYFTETEIQNSAIPMRRQLVNANGVPTSNLGSPSVAEMALFQEQFNNKTEFYDITKIKFYTSPDNVNWTEITTFTDANKKLFVGGDATTNGITIPNNTTYFRIEIENNGNYVYLNALYMYWQSSGHSSKVRIWSKPKNTQVWGMLTNSNDNVSSWPGHLFLPFPTIPFHPNGTSHADAIRIEFENTWNLSSVSNPSGWNLPIYLHKMQIWGGYPAGKRTIYSVNSDKGVTFPAVLNAGSIYENGGSVRVYSDNNKPSPDDIGAMPKIGGAFTGPVSFNDNITSDGGYILFTGLDSINFDGAVLANVSDPYYAQDAATKNYVDSLGLGDLFNVAISSPGTDHAIVWNGTSWANTAINKTFIGLSSVENYGIATQAEAEAGTSGLKYMTPQRTEQAIRKRSIAQVITRTVSATLALTDENDFVYVNSSSALTFTIPPNSSVAFPVGTEIHFMRYGTGEVSLAPGSGVTLLSDGTKRRINTQYQVVTIKKILTDTWVLFGAIKT